jgi:glycine/D-amino acid oxidase-like deaminating enzyme
VVDGVPDLVRRDVDRQADAIVSELLDRCWHGSAIQPAGVRVRPVERYDVVVVGVGGMGSSALYHLARRGKRVLGLERFDLLHEHGSSHGLTRIIRLAYFEHPDYVPLLRRAYELWRELESEAGEQLLHVTGIVEGGEHILDGVLHSCAEHDIAHEVLTGAEVAERFPAYRLAPEMQVAYQADGGFVVPERCIVAHVEGALARGGPCEHASACSGGTRPRAASVFGPSVESSRPTGSS